MKKEPISTELIKKMIDKFTAEGASLRDLRIAALCTLGFVGFFRFSELSKMLCKHMVFLEEHIKIFVPYSKTFTEKEILCHCKNPFQILSSFYFA